MVKIKNYKINEGSFVIFETLQSLQSTYYGSLPDDVVNEIKNFKSVLLKYIVPNDSEYRTLDYKNIDYFIKVTYGKKLKEKNSNHR